jgi:hypothetical protein
MRKHISIWTLLVLAFIWLIPHRVQGQSLASGTVDGIVKDQTGAVVAGASVDIHNPVSGYTQTGETDPEGKFRFRNVPLNPYHLRVSLKGFETLQQDVDVRSSVPLQLNLVLKVSSAKTTVIVESGAADLIENVPIAHTDVDRNLFSKMPLESASSSVSSLITLSTPGVAADSNGLFHGLGEHQENSFLVDGQPITDQQSKIFSNQIPLASIQSLEVVNGIPPAEYGDKTSLVINVVTRSGLGLKPTGGVTSSYGSFGTAAGGFNLAAGSERFGNFISADGVQSGRFLDPPEFVVLHAKGNSQNLFDRVDFQPSTNNSFHLNFNYSRSWFQTPNSLDQAASGQDQRTLVQTFNVAPGWTHLFSSTTLLAVTAFVRQDRYHYFPSADAFSDLPATLAQTRRLTNAGVRADFSYVKGAHNIKAGASLHHWFLDERFNLGITDPTFNPVCFSDDGLTIPVTDQPTLTNPGQCAGAGFFPNTTDNGFLPGLVAFDLTRGGSLLDFTGHADIKEVSLYVQDAITLGSWSFQVGLRGDLYRGLSSASSAQPRLGAAYNIKKTNTVLRVGYARALVTPYNENLILSSSTGLGGLGAGQFGAFGARPPEPGHRNLFTAGLQQALGRYLVVQADYYWKYTSPDYDFGVLFNTPLTFPVQWTKSKIDGLAARVSVPDIHGFSAVLVLGTTRSRFFPPEIGGLIFNAPISTQVFRIDHDQAFQQTTHVQYQWKNKRGPWIGFTWRYDSGLVAGAVPFATDTTTPVDLTGLTADQQLQAGLFCGNTFPTLSSPLTTCAPSLYGSTRVQIPAPGTENNDLNPPHVVPRHLFDAAIGADNIFHGDRYKWSARLTVINLTNKVALYNFLSTFSGTHFVTPRTFTGELGFHF